MEPFFFGAPGAKLFGAYHAASGCSERDSGVILCYPMGREYLNALRSYRLLAEQLADSGFPVLRFDYSACGDSEGDCREGSITLWREDVWAAMGELRRRRRVSRFCLAGLRLGASIAMLAAAGRAEVQALVLWDPVIQGGPYLRELRRYHRHAFWETPPALARSMRRPVEDELLGFAMGERLRRELSSMDLLTLELPPVQNALLIQTAGGRQNGQLRARWEGSAAHLEHHHLPAERLSGRDFRSSFGSLTRSRTVSLVSAWISGVCP